jgi:mono/diheme cytochrome c family protein
VRSAQREATIVAMGLVIIISIVVVYLLNEENRRDTAAERHFDTSIHRGAELYVDFCLSCHGGEGLAGEGRLGVPLNTSQNQTDDPALGPQREEIIRDTIERGRGQVMPAWSNEHGGPLNHQQVEDLVNLIRAGAWDLTHELDLELHGGVPATPPPAPTPDPDADPGMALFEANCTSCHISNDFPNGGMVGPDLTGLGQKDQTDVVGIEVNAEALSEWIKDPKAIKPDTIMPAVPLSDEERELVVEYLLGLE